MASFPNVRTNRINAQTVTSNFYQGSNADITNIACDNLAVSNFVFNDATFNGDVLVNSTTQSTSPTTGALIVVGGVGVGKNLNIGQNLGVTQNAGITGYVDIYNSTNTDLAGTTGALIVVGGVAIGKNLFVGGTSWFNNNVNIFGDLGVTGNLGITGNVNLYGDLGITGNVDLYGDLGITGNVDIYGDLGITGNVDIYADLGITGNVNIYGDLGITGNVDIYGDLGITGNVDIYGDLGITGNVDLYGDLGITGNVVLYGDFGMTGNGEVYGDFRVWEYLSIGNSIGPGTSQLHLNYENGSETGKNFQINADSTDNISIQHYMSDNLTTMSNFMSMNVGNSNTSLGCQALQQQSNADYKNTAIGYLAGNNLLTGTDNTYIGNLSGMTGTGHYNTFVGSQSGTTGFTGATGCVCVGYQSGLLDYGNYNTLIGFQAGWTGTTHYGGTGLICIGANAYPSDSSASNECTIFIGSTSGSNTARFAVGGGTWTFSSDARDKTDINIISSGIDLINQIQPSKYRWDKREWYENGVSDGSKKNEIWYSGFIAQQLDAVQSENQAEYLNLVYKSNPNKLEIAPSNLIPVIVKALQDLSNENNDLKLRLEKMEEIVASLNLHNQ